MTIIEARRRSHRPYEVPGLAALLGVPYWRARRIVQGTAPATAAQAYLLAGLFGCGLDDLFEEREYRHRKQRRSGFFARPIIRQEGAA